MFYEPASAQSRTKYTNVSGKLCRVPERLTCVINNWFTYIDIYNYTNIVSIKMDDFPCKPGKAQCGVKLTDGSFTTNLFGYYKMAMSADPNTF
jgi:hypothetical protein